MRKGCSFSPFFFLEFSELSNRNYHPFLYCSSQHDYYHASCITLLLHIQQSLNSGVVVDGSPDNNVSFRWNIDL